MKQKRVVIALGGNALGENIEEQKMAVVKTAGVIVDLYQQGYDIIVTHGNGPQVGRIQNAMQDNTPLPTCVAMSQGYIGIDLQNAIKYELYRRDISGKVSTILSQVEVEEKDPSFNNPTKPIGSFFDEKTAEIYRQKGIPCIEDSGRGYRMVVPSPNPKRIVELKTIETLLGAGHIVITCGGGGIPVINQKGYLVGVNAVIDKDLVSSLLAKKIDADYLIILTAVEKVAINFGKVNQEWITKMTVKQARQYIEENQFPKGSMLPKIEAAIDFASWKKENTALITRLDLAADGLMGITGTRIMQED